MPECVVVIEDEPLVLQLLQDMLTMAGYESIGIIHPDRVGTVEAHPALFLIDIMLPLRTGIEVARWLRDNGYPGTPMIAMSASAEMLDLAASSDLFQTTVRKPFEIAELLDRVEEYVGSP